jgi:hypothetical protein
MISSAEDDGPILWGQASVPFQRTQQTRDFQRQCRLLAPGITPVAPLNFSVRDSRMKNIGHRY